MNNHFDERFESIRALAGEMQRLAVLALQQYTPVVDNIIGSNSKDVHYIEHNLDRLLDFCFFEPMVQLFRRLCRYYYDIDPNATVSYVYTYRDMWDSEEPKESPSR